MEQGDNPKKLSFPSLFSHLTEWSGWEYLYEERRKVTAIALLVICFVLGLGWIISRKQSSSLGKIIQAESIVDTITDSSNDEPEATIQKNVDTLFSLSKDPEVSSRFCEVLAQEEILANKKGLTKEFFDSTAEQLSQQKSPALSSLMQLTLLQKKGLWKEALLNVDELKGQFHTPWFSTYLLIQKVRILAELGQPNAEVIDELRSVASRAESINEFFEEWLHTSANDFFDSLAKK